MAVPRQKQRFRDYLIAVAVLVMATLVRLLLDPALGDRAPLVSYILAVALTGWLCGFGPGMVTLILGGITATYLFIEPRGSFFVAKRESQIGLGLYFLTGLIINVLSRAQRSATARAEASTRQGIEREALLEAEVGRRERIEREREELLAEQARLRAVAEEQSATLASLLDQAPIAIVLYDAELRHVRANSKAASMIGQTSDQVLGRTFRDVVAGAMPEANLLELERLYRQTIESGEPVSIRAWNSGVERPEGGFLFMDLSIRRVDRPEGGMLGLLGTYVDVTEARQAEQALQEADRRKNEFLAVLAHEIRNPLASIRNSLRLMKQADDQNLGGADREPEREMAERQVTHLARLVDDLMDVSRITRGRIELRKEPVDLAAIILRAVEASQPSVERRGHVLSVDLPPEPIRIEADPTRLEQVFGNLLANAVKYTLQSGRIGVSVVLEGGEVVVTVRDSGLGIGPAMLPRVFEMFVQDDRHSGHSQGGLGIGLGLSKSLVELHGGKISAWSEGSGLGSEFEVRLPKPPIHPTLADRKSSSPQPLTRRRVLVVDDNEAVARSLAKLLERMYGQDVRVAHDGPSALELAGEFRPEVVLLDIGMPEMDGCEVARRLRQRPEFAETLLVALTGWGQDADRKRSQEAGIDHHLVKPIDPDQLGPLIASARA